jgi:hypothetical protein
MTPALKVKNFYFVMNKMIFDGGDGRFVHDVPSLADAAAPIVPK